MIYGTNILYKWSDRAGVMQVVETADGYVTRVYPFEKELHSMVWYDAIVLCDCLFGKALFDTMDDLLASVAAKGGEPSECSYAYGVNRDAGRYIFIPLK